MSAFFIQGDVLTGFGRCTVHSHPSSCRW